MSKFRCRCDYVIDLSVSPADEEHILISEKALESISEKIEAGNCTVDDYFSSINKNGKSVLVCPNCNRYWVMLEDKTYTSFIKEPN